MKRLLLFTLPLLLIQSCGKNGGPTASVNFDFRKPYTLPSAPEANALCDTSLRGIYKGVTINAGDEAATVELSIANGGDGVFGREYMDGVVRDSLVRYMVDPGTGLLKYPLSRDVAPINTGARYHTIFESFLPDSANAFVQFAVERGGLAPLLDVNLKGNQTLDAVLKEQSNRQVFCFEGSYEGGYINGSASRDTGRVAFVVRADTAIVIMASIASPQFFPASGAAANDNKFTIPVYDGPGDAAFVLTCKVTGNTCSGTWVRINSTATGTFTAHRTL